LSNLKITSIDAKICEFEIPDFGTDQNGTSLIYQAGNKKKVKSCAIQIHTNQGITGEFVGGEPVAFAQFCMFAKDMIGKDPTKRELIYNNAKRCLRKFDRMGIGLADIALWDLAGKLYEAPIYELLGGWKTKLPAYASTLSGDRSGGLDSPEAFADFAVQCQEMGYTGYKLHIWDDYSIKELTDTMNAVRTAVGDEMHLMIDPACKLKTFSDALEIGWACDDAKFLWLEDPYLDNGTSITSHKMLRQKIKTPLLQTEHIRGLEEHVNFVVGEGTDFLRADAEYDGGITGALKIAHAAEGFGLDVELHCGGPAHRHVMASLRNTNFYEIGLVHPKTSSIGWSMDVYACDYRDALDEVDNQGNVDVPTGPGLGVQYDWKFINKNAINSVNFS
jgi:L-alanine-DL-glutamate epimerase-like enolase superfamily enzyme